jgi:hypothetical protein
VEKCRLLEEKDVEISKLRAEVDKLQSVEFTPEVIPVLIVYML